MKATTIVLMLALGLLAKTLPYGESILCSEQKGEFVYSTNVSVEGNLSSTPIDNSGIILTDYSRGGDYFCKKSNYIGRIAVIYLIGIFISYLISFLVLRICIRTGKIKKSKIYKFSCVATMSPLLWPYVVIFSIAGGMIFVPAKIFEAIYNKIAKAHGA